MHFSWWAKMLNRWSDISTIVSWSNYWFCYFQLELVNYYYYYYYYYYFYHIIITSVNHHYFIFQYFISNICSVINYVPDVLFLLTISKFSCCKFNLWLYSPAIIYWFYTLLERIHCIFMKHNISKTRVTTLLPKTNI